MPNIQPTAFGAPSHQLGVTRVFFIAVIVCLLGIAASCLLHALRWVDKPFASFLFYQFPSAGSFGDYEWPGLRAGIRYRDIILEVNGRPVSSSADIEAVVQATPIGQSIEYMLDRRGERIRVSVPVSRFSTKDFIALFGFPFLNGLIYWAIGIIVSIMKPDTEVTRAHFLMCLFVGAWMLTGFELQSNLESWWSYHANMWAFAFYPAALFHLSLIFPERTSVITRWPRLPVALYSVSLAMAVMHSALFMAAMTPGPGASALVSVSSQMLKAIYVNRVYGVLGAVSIVLSSVWAVRRSRSIIAKQRARIILISSGLTFIPPTVITGLGSLAKITIPFNLSVLAAPFFPAAIGYAIARHNLFDVDVYIKRTVGYVLMTGIVAGAYFAFQSLVKTAILDPLLGASSEKVYPFLFALLTVFAFNPLSQQVQQLVDKLFYRKQYDYKATVAAMTESLASLVDVQTFIERVIHTVRRDLFVDRAGVLLIDERPHSVWATFHGRKFGDESPASDEGGDPCLSPDDPLLALLAKERKLITKYDVAEDPRYGSVRGVCGQRFEELGASLALPLYYREQFAGVLALGYKQSGHFYTREDIELLKTLSAMTSTAIEQSREKGQKAVLMQLFSKHVSPQVAESLWEQREQFLEGGRPKSQSMVVTAMFTDLQGFSTLSEKQSPEVLMGWLNTYLDMMTTTVMEHGGVVDDFFGDGVKINFGVPIPRETEDEIRQDAINAVQCALAMEARMIDLNNKMAAEGQQPLRMRVGIYTGSVVAGSLGSAERMKYTTLGDTVNTAARLESYDKELVLPELEGRPCRILIGESTLQYVEGRFVVKKVGELSLKGKAQAIGAYCVLGALEGPPAMEAQGVSTRRNG